MSDAQLQPQLWTEAAQPPLQQQPQQQQPQQQLPQQQQVLQQPPDAFARASGPAAFNNTLLADMTLGCGW